MRHIILIMFAFVTLNLNAQTSEQKEILKEIEGTYQLDDDFGYSYVRIFENLNATKEEIHAKALSFFPYLVVGTYDAREIIQHENVEEGVIIAKVACNQLASHVSLAHFYIVSATPIIRIDIKGEFYQFNLSSCIRQQNSLTAQFVSFSLANLANIFYPPPDFYNN